MLDRMAELFEVPVSVLLGGGLEVEEEQPSELNEIAQQLAVLNDQLVQQAVRRRKVIRYAFVGVFAAIFVLIGAAIGLRVYTESQLRDEASLRTVRYECTLDGESYVYEASYNSQYHILVLLRPHMVRNPGIAALVQDLILAVIGSFIYI